MKRRTKNLAKRALMWITTFALLLCEIPFPAAITFADEITASAEVNYVDEADSEEVIEEAFVEEEAQEDADSQEEEEEEETTTTTAADEGGEEEVTSDNDDESEEETAEVDPANAGESGESSDVVISGSEGESGESVEAQASSAEGESSEEYIVDPASEEETSETESVEESSEEETPEESTEETSVEETSVEETLIEETMALLAATVDTTVTVSYVANPTDGGTVSIKNEDIIVPADQEYESGEGATAIANDGYVFVNWTDEAGNEVETEATFIPTVTAESGALTYTANFSKIEETWTVNFHNRDGEIIDTVNVVKGEALESFPAHIEREDYNAYWAEGKHVDDAQGGHWEPETRIDESKEYIPAGNVDIVPDYDKITYTVTFYADETLSEEVATKTVDVDTSYCLNDIPSVPTKNGYTGKWVYAGGDFTNSVAINDDTSVWAEYNQNVFTVTYIVDGKTYDTDTYYSGDTLVLPADPVVEGKEFQGWFVNDTQYTGGETVTSDLTITAKLNAAYSVTFVYKDKSGEEVEFARYYRKANGTEPATVGTLPQNPFVSGKVFEKWVIKDTTTEVTADTEVIRDMVVEASFRTVNVYSITAEYYYMNDNGDEVIFNTDLLQAEAHELPYTITAPATTQTSEDEVHGAPVYYPETPTKEVSEVDFDSDKKCTVRFKYVKNTAVYDFVYLLKDLDGEGYTEIDRTSDVEGVLGSVVTPTVKSFDYATLDHAESATITTSGLDGQPKQELKAYYNRKSFSLSYETNGGSYVSGQTVAYGSVVNLPETNPTRTGYVFDGWYSDAELTEPVTGTITIIKNTTLYAKWKGDSVHYTIVYMFEKYNDTGTTSSYVYDNSRDATGTVGSTVQASSAPSITRTGWEVDAAKNATSSVEIKADGSSVLFVYYKLREYTFNFNAGTYTTGGWGSQTYNVNATLVGKNVSGTGTLNYTMTVKLGQDISSAWPANVTGQYTTGGWRPETYDVGFYGWVPAGTQTVYVTKRTQVTEDMLPSSGSSITYTAVWSNSTYEVTINYWLQNADNDQYTKSTTYSQTVNTTGGEFSAKDIAGYTYNSSKDDHKWTGGWGSYIYEYNFYYDRGTYKIDYYYGSNKLDTIEDVKFDANINKAPYVWTPTAAQCGVDNDYTFAGWYSDASLTAEYTFSKMPASNLVLYAKWTAPTFTVSFVDGENTSTVYSTSEVEKNKKVSAPETTPTKDGYVFEGWYSTADGEDLYDWNNQITEDTTIYAHWSPKMLSYIVHYVDEDGNSVAPDKEVTNPNFIVGQVITETAIAVAGYRPEENSKTITLNSDGNEITFVYQTKAGTTSYKVRYLIADGEVGAGTAVAGEKEVINVPGDTTSVIELAEAVDYDALYTAVPALRGVQFHPDEVEKTLVLAADEQSNVLTFYYSSFKNAKVTVHFVDMAGNQIASDTVSNLKVSSSYTLSRTPITGWEFKKAVEGTDYTDPAASTGEYSITEEVASDGLEFTLFYQKKVTITVNSQTKQYDGMALTLPADLQNQVSVEGLLDGHTLTSIGFTYVDADVADGKGRVNEGTATVTPKDAVISGAPVSVTNDYGYYSIRYISGTLEVTKLNVTIRIEPDRWTGAKYNGSVYEAGFSNGSKTTLDDYIMISHAGYKAEYQDDIWNAIIGLENVKQQASPSGLGYYVEAQKDAGDYTYNIGLTLADLPQNDNYSVSLYVRPGRLQILPKDATVTTGSATKAYDGSPLTNSEANITGLVAADAENVTVTATGSQTEVGSSNNTYSITWGEGTRSSNYTLTENLGTLEVTASTLSITVKDATKTYNGTEQAGNSISTVTGTGEAIDTDEYSVTGLAKGHVLTAAYTAATGTTVGTYENGAFDETAIKVEDADGNDVTRFYEVETTEGKLTIAKKAVTITADSDEKVYDGTELTKDRYTSDGLAEGDSIQSVTITGSQTVVGTADNVPSAAKIVNAAEEDVTASYEINYVNGTLKVTKKQLTITAGSDTKVYDGTPLVKNAYTQIGLVSTDRIDSVTVTGSRTDVGTSDNVASAAVIKNSTGEDVTSSYDINYVNGTLEVTKASMTVTVTGNKDTKVYNGAEQKVTGYEATSDSTLFDEDKVGFTGTAEAKGTVADTYPMGLAKEQFSYDNANIDVTFVVTDGSITITPLAVTITADSDSKVYDGTALTKDSYTNTALATGDKIDSVIVTGSQTVVGKSSNVPSAAKIVNSEDEDVTSSYTISYVNGELEVTSKKITITADSDTKVYDGTALTKNSFTNTALGTGDSIESVTVTGSQTVVGKSDNVASAAKIVNAAGEDVTASYEIEYVNGSLEVTKKAITITAASDTKVYDGTALTNTGYTSTTLATSDSIESVTVTGSQTVVGSSNNVPTEAKIVNAANEDVTASYEITYANGTLEVTKKTLTITADTDTKVYDGTALTKDSYTNTALAEGDEIESVTITGSQTVVGESNNVPSSAKIVNAAGTDVTASYEITYTNGTLTVTQKPITITADSDTKAYDGTALTKNSYTNSALAEGDRIVSVTVTGSQTEAGTSDNVPSAAKIVNADDEDVTASYNITYANGTLTVTPAALTITADSDSKVYDGTALTKNSYKHSGLAEGDSIESVTVTGSQTVVGSSDNVPSAAKIINAVGEDVTASYTIEYKNGTLEVTKKAVTITADSDTKVYDGTALTKNTYQNTALAAGDSIESVTVTGSQTVVGSSDNVPSAAVIKNTVGEDVTESYAITYANGTLEVTKKAVTITAESDTKVYDGTALTKNTYTNTTLAEGDSIDSVTITGSQTIVGSSDNVPSAAKIVNAAGDDVTSSYTITYANGTLEVTKKAMTITADSDEKVYDGTALTKDSFTKTDLAEGDSIESVTVTGSQTVVGSSDNVPSAAKIVNAKGEDVTASYEITYANGTLEVTKKAVTITADSDTKVYDGTALTKDTYKNTDLAVGDSIDSVTVTGSQTVVGSSDNVPSAAKIVNAAGTDVTASYEITYANGTLEVTQKELTITADSDTKVYDGIALTKDSYTNTALATGDSIASVTVTGSQTVVGSSDNVPSAAKIVNAKGEEVTASYKITYANGTLEVTKKIVTITADSAEKVYDGTALTKNSYTNTALAEGDSIASVTVTGSQTVVGSSDNVPSAAKIINAAGEDVTASYEITYANGTLEVTKKAVTITADSDTKVYDGTALTKDSYTNTVLAEGDSIESVTVTGSQTVVGKSNNVPSATVIKNAAGEDVTASYEITYANGTLEVTKKAVTITADSDTKVYDGTALTKDSYANTDLAEGDKIESVTVTGSQTVVGKSNNVPSAAKIANANGDDVTASYEITYANGTLEVTKKAVTITADSDTKVYDGTALTKDSYTKTDLAEGDSIESVTVTGSQTVVGKSNNVPSAAKIVNADGEDVTASYEITYANGTLEVTKKAVTITADSDTKVYDGTALIKDSYTNTELAAGDSIESVTVTGTQIVVGSSNNVPSAAKIVNADGEDVTDSYEITYANGTLEVTQKELTITAKPGTKVYDGTELTNAEYETTALAEGDSIESVTVTGTQTIVGKSDNVPSAAKIVNAAGEDVTASYKITYVNGTLEVTKKAVTITAKSEEFTYDGTAHSNSEYTVDGLVGSDAITAVVEGSITFVSESPVANVVKSHEFTAGSADNYDVSYANGSLTMKDAQVAITITAASKAWTYDGEAHSNNAVTVTEGELLTGDTLVATATGSVTNVSDTRRNNNTVAPGFKIMHGDENVTASYKITYVNGTLTINPKAVTITAQDKAFAYDGNAKSWPEYDVDGLVGQDAITAVVTGSITFPSESPVVNKLESYEFTKGIPGNYAVTTVDGKLTMTNAKAEITITAASDEWSYDGTAHTNTEVELTSGTLFEGDELVATANGSVTNVADTATGNNPVAEGYKVMHGTEDVTANYAITPVAGTLTINPASVTITAKSEEFTYDGTAHSDAGYDVTGLVGQDAVTAVVEGRITFPSESPVANVVKSHEFTTGTAGNYSVSYVDGELTMANASAAITITAASQAWTYDGEAHTNTEVTVTEGELLSGDTLVAEATGSVTNVADTKDGNNPVKDGYRVMHGNEDVTANYTITAVDGKLTINPAAVTITAENEEFTYDGAAHSNANYKVEGLVGQDAVTAVVEGSITFPSESPVANIVKSHEFTTGTAGNYDVTYANGQLTMTNASTAITITAASEAWDYDGNAHSNNEVTVTSGNLLTGDTLVAEATGSVTNVTDTAEGNNSIAEGYKVMHGDEDVTANYVITPVNGTLTIKPISVKVTVTEDKDSVSYDGKEHTIKGYASMTADNELYDVATSVKATETKAWTVTETNAGTYDMGIVAADFENTNPNFTDVTFEVVDGQLVISPISVKVTVTEKSDSVDYNGQSYTISGYESMVADSELYDVATSVKATETEGWTVTETNAGTYDMSIVAGDFENINKNFSDVTFEVVDGQLEIKPIKTTVTIVGNNNTAVYDGAEHTVTGYTATVETELYDVDKDFTFSGTAEAKRTEVGTTNMGLIASQFTNTNKNFEEVTFNVTDGYQTITAVDEVVVTITGHTNTAPYDGKEHSISGYDVEISNPLYTEKDFTFSGTANAVRTDVGKTDMGLVADQFANTNGNFSKVTFNVTDGYQEVTPIDVTVTIVGANNTTDYDGAEHTVSGYTATANTQLYDVTKDFTFSGTAEAKRTDVGTTDMGLAAEQFANTNTNFGTVTFEVTDGYQKIDPIDVTVTIVGNNNTTDYDGEAHTVTGYTATADNKLYDVEKDFIFSGEATASRTDAGTTNMGLTAGQFANTNTNFANVTFNVTDGYQTIDPIDVTVTIVGNNNTTDYDGEEHTVEGYEATADNKLYDVEKDFTFSGEAAASRTDAGTTEMGLAAGQFTNTNANFASVTFNVTDGYQKINPIDVTVTITGHHNTTTYDAKEHSVSGYDVEISNPLYTEDDFTFSGTAEAARTAMGTTSMGLAAEQFANTNSNFATVTFNVTDGYQAITAVDEVVVTITGHSNTTAYDGAEHSVSGYDVEISNPLYTENDFTFGGTAEAKRTDAGTTHMGLAAEQFTNNNENFSKVTFNVTDGYQTIDPINVVVTITENSGEEKYDGTEKTITGYTADISNPLYTEKNFTFNGNDTVTGTDAGSYAMELKSEDFTNTSENFKNVEFKIVDGALTITKRIVTLTSADDEKVYDGSALTNDEITVGGDGFAEGEGASYSVTGTQTEVGESANAFTYTLNEGTKAANYNITTAEGTLKVTELTDKVTVTITENSGSEKYDGTEKTVTGYTAAIDNKLYTEADFTFSGNATVKGTDAGSYAMELKPEDFTNTNKNFSNVEFVIVDGTLEIAKREVTLTSFGETRPYDGTALTKPDVTVTGDGFVVGEASDIKATGTITEAGSVTNTITYTEGEKFKADNYTITKKEGTLTITALTETVTVTITEHSGSEKYDGNEKSVSGYDVTSISNPLYTDADFAFSGDRAKLTVAATNAGSYPMELAAADFTNNNGNFATVEFVIVDGTLEIAKRSVTLTSATDSKTYDGTAITNDEVKVTGDGFAANEGATYDVTGSQTDAGSSKNTFDYTLNEGTLADNYDIEKSEGTLTVNAVTDKVTVTITEHSGSETYDGTEKTVTGYDVNISNPLYTEKNFSFSGDDTIKGTDAGSYPMELKAADFANTSKNFTDVEFIIADGTLEIAKRQITVSVADAAADILYDGAEHSGESETTFTNVAEGQTASITYTPAKGTLVGSYTGTFEDDFKVTDAEGNDVTKNYELTEKTAGKLNITDEETPDQPIDPSKVITKEHEGGEFKLGETITWMITVTNIYNEAKAVTVTEAEGVTLGEYPDTLEAGETVTIAATHVVTEDDILNGGFTNKASVELGNIKKEAEDEATTEEIKAHMTVAKTVTNKPADGKTFKTGETIEYQITVKNDGNVTISGITVNDDKTGDSWQTASIAPGAEEVFTAKYTVTEADAAKGEVVNTATAEGTDPKGGAAEVEPGTHTETVERDSVNDIIDPKPGTGESMGADGKTITAKYDGKSHTVSASATKEGSKIEYSTDGGETWTEEAPALTNVGTVSYQIRATHPYYEDVVKTGYTLEITKRSVILTSPDASKRYDGQALTSTNIAVTGDGFVSGEGATYNVTGTITSVGTAQNTFTYTLNPNTLASNYDIRQVFGNLTITRRSSGGSETTPTPGPTPDPTPTPEEPTPTPTPTPEPEIPVAPAAPAAPAVAGAAVTPTVPDAGVLGARLNPPAEEAEAEAPEAEAEGEPEGDVAGEQIQPIQQIEEVEVPLAEGPAGSWALLNLILAAVTTLISGVLLALYFKKKKEDEDEEKEKQAGESRKEDEEEEKEKKKGLIRTLSLIPAAASIITFILTEDMSTQMALTDSWTILMAVYCAANVVAAFASRKKTEDGKEEEANA